MQRGDDVTLVGMSYTSVVCEQAAVQLADAGINAEVIDMMSLSPFDEDILLESVQKTNNVVIVDEDTPRASMPQNSQLSLLTKHSITWMRRLNV